MHAKQQITNPDNRNISEAVLERLRITIINVFSDGQYHEVGVREICRRAKVSPHTIYKYFGTKEQLLFTCIQPEMEVFSDRVITETDKRVNIREKLETFAQEFFDFYFSNPAIAKIVFLNIPASYWTDKAAYAPGRFNRYLSDLIASEESDEFIRGLNVDLVVEIITGAAFRLILNWLVSDQTLDKNLVVSTFTGVVNKIVVPQKYPQAPS